MRRIVSQLTNLELGCAANVARMDVIGQRCAVTFQLDRVLVANSESVGRKSRNVGMRMLMAMVMVHDGVTLRERNRVMSTVVLIGLPRRSGSRRLLLLLHCRSPVMTVSVRLHGKARLSVQWNLPKMRNVLELSMWLRLMMIAWANPTLMRFRGDGARRSYRALLRRPRDNVGSSGFSLENGADRASIVVELCVFRLELIPMLGQCRLQIEGRDEDGRHQSMFVAQIRQHALVLLRNVRQTVGPHVIRK